MGRKGRQRDHSVSLAHQRCRTCRSVLGALSRRRTLFPTSVGSQSLMIQGVARFYVREKQELLRYLNRSRRISLSDFSFNFNCLTDACCLSLFRFRKKDLVRVMKVMGWESRSTSRNRYSCDALVVTCVVLRRLTTPARWKDMEFLFGKHAGQLSEIFWEGLEALLEERMHLVVDEVDPFFFAERAEKYSDAILNKCDALDNCFGFIDRTVIAIARPSRSAVQNVAYNGHKRKHALKFQATTAPDGLVLQIAGPLEGRRHDWTLYCRSAVEDWLPAVTVVDGKQYRLYGDSGYNQRPFLEVPFQGSDLPSYQKAFNAAMSGGRVTVEWFFKEVKLYWSTMDYKRKMRVGESPVGSMYIAAMLLTSFRNCVYPNSISQYFRCQTPTLETYVDSR